MIDSLLTSNTKVICMRPATLTILLVGASAALAPIPATALEAAVNTGGEAWQSTRWGMSKAEIHDAFPQAVDWVERYGNGGPGKEFQKFGIQKYPIEGICYVEVDFFFENGGLKTVILYVGHDSIVSGDDLLCAGIVERGLKGKYGLSATSERGGIRSITTRTIEWVTPSSVTSFWQMKTPVFTNPDRSEVYSYMTVITYQPRKTGVEGKF